MLISLPNKVLEMLRDKNYNLAISKLVGKKFLSALKLCSIFAICLFVSNNAKASGADYSALTKNATLETASLNKALVMANNSANFKNSSNAELNDKKITKKSKELEGVFLSVMMEPMFPEGKESNLYGGGQGNGVFRTLMIQQYGQIFADAGGVGLSAGIEKQFRKQRATE